VIGVVDNRKEREMSTTTKRAAGSQAGYPDPISGSPDKHQLVEMVNKEAGQGAVMVLDGPPKPAPILPTGLAALDRALGVGGLPRGRIVEIFGPEGSGKTTLALQVVAQTQAAGGLCAYVDAEHALDTAYAAQLGVRFGDLLLSQPSSGEQALEVVRLLCRTGCVQLVVVDSVAALTPQAELDGEMGDASIGAQARMMSKALRMLAPALSEAGATVVFINQIRNKVGVIYGTPEVTSGGKALPFYASVRIDVRRRTPIKEGGQIMGHEVELRVIKNKLAPPFRSCLVRNWSSRGFLLADSLLREAEEAGVVTRSGSHWSWRGQALGQGIGVASLRLEQDPQLQQQLLRDWRQAMGWDAPPEAPERVLTVVPDPAEPGAAEPGAAEPDPGVGMEPGAAAGGPAEMAAEPDPGVGMEPGAAAGGPAEMAAEPDPGVGMEPGVPDPPGPAPELQGSTRDRIVHLLSTRPDREFEVGGIAQTVEGSKNRVRQLVDQMVREGRVRVVHEGPPRRYQWVSPAS